MGAYLPMSELKQSCNVPLTKKEIKGLYGNCKDLKMSIKQLLRQKDLEDFVNRIDWYNLPIPLKSTEVERILYQRGQLIFWYWQELDRYMLTPYAHLDGLDVYGRSVYVKPVPMSGSGDKDGEIPNKALADLMANKRLRVIYDPQIEDDYLKEDGSFDEAKAQKLLEEAAVILYDRTPSVSQYIVPRQSMQEGILEVMSECVPFARTALKNSTGVMGIRVQGEDESSNVSAANGMVDHAALYGEKYVPIVGSIEFQDLASGETAKAEEFMQALQAFNNFRLSNYGIDNNGLYDKKAYVNELQSGVSNVGLSLQDAISNRQDFCAIVNSIWDLAVWAELSEVVSGQDINMDGVCYDTDTFEATSAEEANYGTPAE